jgi:hypothetical protein
LVYNTQTVTLINEIQFGNVGGGEFEQPRATMRYQLRPVGYDASADFFAYNSHYKADTGTVNNNRRLAEAQAKDFTKTLDAKWKEMGGQIHPLPPEDLAKMRELLQSVGDDVSKDQPPVLDLLKKVRAVAAKH